MAVPTMARETTRSCRAPGSFQFKTLRSFYDETRMHTVIAFALYLNNQLDQCDDDKSIYLALEPMDAEGVLPEVLCLLLGPYGLNLIAEGIAGRELELEPITFEDGVPSFRVLENGAAIASGSRELLDIETPAGRAWLANAGLAACIHRAEEARPPMLPVSSSSQGGDA